MNTIVNLSRRDFLLVSGGNRLRWYILHPFLR
jgi:hypothetical protein